ncbi:hypothetical protein INT47_003404 [Mucor saturninus]|uniref:WIBG Mago-binding domain-containing protein n=1 Tax=Mucor saturninus TaxID=64648 RepID=A0A8H7RHY5_9FUNG|nr:hypothetical protein INT47_003404 [Mucor saturninus]
MSEPSNAGIVKVGEERIIPGSQRADGSFRKERKVRPGFTPLEDVKRYTIPQRRTANPGSARPEIPVTKRNEEVRPAKFTPVQSVNRPLEKNDNALDQKVEKKTDQKSAKEDEPKEKQQEQLSGEDSLVDSMAKLSLEKSSK